MTWGDAKYGGDSSAVQDQLKNVQQIQATTERFYQRFCCSSSRRIRRYLGDAYTGGDSSAVHDQLNVQQIQTTAYAFCCHSWRTGPSWPGTMLVRVVTVVRCSIR